MTPQEIAINISNKLRTDYKLNLDPRFIYAQMWHETGNFTSELANKYHNYGGVTQQEPNLLMQPDGSMYYKSFNSDEDYVNYMAYYYSLYEVDGLFKAQNIQEYAEALKRGGYFGDTVENYVSGMTAGYDTWIGEAPSREAIARPDMQGHNGVLGYIAAANNTDSHGAPLIPAFSTEQDEEEPTFGDKLLHPIMEAPLVKTLRVGLAKATNPAAPGTDYVFTKEDMDLVNKEFNGDTVSQNFIYSNSNSHEQLVELVQMQKESKEMERRIANSSYGVNTLGSFAGNVIAEALNPLNYIGLGFINKGTLAAKVLKSAAFNGALNVADSGIRERLTGMEQNLVTSAGVGMAVGAAMPLVARLAVNGANKLIRDTAGEAAAKMQTVKSEADAVLDNTVPTRTSIFERFKRLHDVDFAPHNERMKRLIDTGKAIVIPKDKLNVVGRLLKFDLPENTRAFNVGDTTFFVKEVVSNMDDKSFDNLLLHEIGVHAMPAELKEPVLSFVRKQMDRPKGLWREALDRATAATPKGDMVDPEEVLGYWAELRGDDPKGGFLSDLTERFNKALGRTDMTSRDVLEIIKQNRDDVLFAKEADGDVVKLSADGDVTQNSVVRLGQDDRPKQNTVSRFYEDSALFGTPYGKLTNSPLKYARQIGKQLFSDARQRSTNVTMTAEDVKSYVQGQINIPYKKLMRSYRNYAFKRFGLGMYLPKNVETLNREIMLYHDYFYAGHILPEGMEVDNEIASLAKLLNETEAMEIKMAKQFGYITDPYWENLDKGTRRVFNQEKWQQFINNYQGEKGVERAQKDLEEYFYAAAQLKREENRVLLQRIIDTTNETIQKEWGEISAPDFALESMTEQNLDDFIRSEAAKAAKGYIDLDTSNIGNSTKDDGAVMPWMRHRIHMDTSYETVLNGQRFSFDDNLRSYDLQLILNRTTNRWAGEIALSTVFRGKTAFDTIEGASKQLNKTLDNYRQMLINEGKQRVAAGGCSQSQADEALRVFDDSVRELRGLPQQGSNSAFAYAVDTLRKFTYARVGGNMGLNQLIDFGNAVGYVGFRTLTSMLPYVGRKMQRSLFGANYLEASSEQVAKLMGDGLRDLNFANAALLNSKRGNYFKNGSALDTLNNITNVMSEITNNISGLSNLTTRMIRDVRMFTYMDMLKAVRNFSDDGTTAIYKDTFGLFGERQPFSKKKLAAAGIHDKRKFFNELKGYLRDDGQLDIDAITENNPTLHAQLWKLIDNQAKRAVVEPTLGNKNLLASSSAFFKMLFQFKNFSFYATQSQAFRKMSSRELDDVMSTIYEGLMAAGVVYIGVQGAAWAKHGTNEQARRDYIDKRMDDFYYGVATRSGTIGSPMAFIIDGLDALGIQESFRTTTGSRRYKNTNDPMHNIFRFISQSPALETLSLMFQNAFGYINTGVTQKNVEDSFKTFIPANNWYPLATLLNSMVETFDIPEK